MGNYADPSYLIQTKTRSHKQGWQTFIASRRFNYRLTKET